MEKQTAYFYTAGPGKGVLPTYVYLGCRAPVTWRAYYCVLLTIVSC